MKEVFLEILQTVIIAIVPVIAGYVAVQIKAKITSSVKNETERRYAEQIASAVSDAVLMTSQTYVDSLKKTGVFSEEAQKEAAKKALNACLAAISPTVREYISEAYGSVTAYLSTKIEAEVRAQKSLTTTN